MPKAVTFVWQPFFLPHLRAAESDSERQNIFAVCYKLYKTVCSVA